MKLTTTVKKLNETFKGKICTVLTVGISKINFNDIQFADFFTGFIESIDEDGVWTRHHLSGCKNFYPMAFVVGIMEEQVVEETDPEYKKIIEKVEKTPEQNKPFVQPYDVNNSPFVNPEMLAALAKKNQSTMTRKN